MTPITTTVQTPSTRTRQHEHSPDGASELIHYLPPDRDYQTFTWYQPIPPLAESNEVNSARKQKPSEAAATVVAQLLVCSSAIFSMSRV